MSWIDVKERYPELDTPVLCSFIHWHTKNRYHTVLVFTEDNWRIWDIGYMCEFSNDYTVTHWMPIPEIDDL